MLNVLPIYDGRLECKFNSFEFLLLGTGVLSCLVLYKDSYLTFLYYFVIYKLMFALQQFYYLFCNFKMLIISVHVYCGTGHKECVTI